MKSTLRYFVFGVTLFIMCPVLVFAQANHDVVRDKQVKAADVVNPQNQPAAPPNPNVEWVKDATKKYSPASWKLLMKYDKMPNELEGRRKGWWIITLKKPVGTFDELKGEEDDKLELIGRMALNLRVVDLAMQRHDLFLYAKEKQLEMDWDNAEVLMTLPSGKPCHISFPVKAMFPSSKLAQVIPKDRRGFYYKTYVKKADTVSQRFGVIGLVQEYQGYYFGSQYYFDMFEAYKVVEDSDVKGFFEWVRHSQSTMGAFYELDYLIREYLLYMKEHRPADYEALKSCKPFGEAYGTLRSTYESLLDRYLRFIDAEIERLHDEGMIDIGMDDGLLWIKAINGKSVTGTHVLPDRKKLQKLLKSDRYLGVIKDFPKK